ncbi:hypothetical protein ACFE04_028560 [Oxalis oulophora]
MTLTRAGSSFSGPWVVHAVGAIQCFAGYFLMWASVVGFISKPPVWLMCSFMLLAAHAQTFFNTANVVTGVRNFGRFGGTIVGIMKGFLGLSGAILIQLYATFFKGHPSTFILILALTPTLVSLFLMHFIKIDDTRTVEDKRHLDSLSAISLIIAAYLMIIIIFENVFSLPSWASIVMFIVLLLLLTSPLEIAIRAHREDKQSALQQLLTGESSSADKKNQYHELPSDDESCEVKDHESLCSVEDMNIWQAMKTLNFWLLFIAMICGMGSGLATINNISQVGESLGYSMVERNSLVALWSIWNFLGRFGAGYVSDVLLHKRGLARPLFIAVTLGIMTLGHIVIALGFPANLYVGSIIVGVCYGSQWSLMPTITSEIFGVGHMGTIFNTIAIASPVGSYIFSVRVIGYLYDKVATNEDNSCFGSRCFMLSFLIMASVAFLGCVVAFVLFFRTKRFYQSVVLRRLR